MNQSDKHEREELVEALLDELSDVVLICYLAYSGGSKCLRDLFEALKDAEYLSAANLKYNLEIVRQKKGEAHRDPMRSVFERLMRLEHTMGAASDAKATISMLERANTIH